MLEINACKPILTSDWPAAYWAKNGETPKAFTIDLACRFVAIARGTKCIDDAACERLEQMRQDLEDCRRGGLTDKNTALIRQR